MREHVERSCGRRLGIGICSAALVALAWSAAPSAAAEDPNLARASSPAGAGSGPADPAAPQGFAATVIDLRIDLSNFQSTTAGNWNNISNLNGLTTGLIDYNSGGATLAAIDGTGSSWSDFFGDEGGTFPNQDWLIQPATVDGAGLGDGEIGTFQITGLSGGPYQVELVAARTTFGYLNTFTVNGATADRTYLGTPVVTPWNATTDGLTPGNWLIWDAVVPVGGVITIVDEADAETLGILNAIRVIGQPYAPPLTQAIPTVTTVGIVIFALALAGLALGLVRRRRTA